MAGAAARRVREGGNMDQRIMLVVLGVAALAFASLAFASGGQGWNASGLQAGSWNGTIQGHGMMRGFDWNETHAQLPEGWNGTRMMRGFDGNGTRMAPQGNESCAGRGTMPRFNSTEQKAFEAAVDSGDFTAAAKLHEEYGFGGPMFEKLNATTFARFSQVHRLQSGLMADLGMEKMPGMMAGEGFGRMQGGRGKGMGMQRQMD